MLQSYYWRTLKARLSWHHDRSWFDSGICLSGSFNPLFAAYRTRKKIKKETETENGEVGYNLVAYCSRILSQSVQSEKYNLTCNTQRNVIQATEIIRSNETRLLFRFNWAGSYPRHYDLAKWDTYILARTSHHIFFQFFFNTQLLPIINLRFSYLLAIVRSR